MMTNKLDRRALLGIGIGAFACTGTVGLAQTVVSDVDPSSLRRSKTTQLGLYLTPKAAHQALLDNPDILFVDVRDPTEITFVGHADGIDKIIPLGLSTHDIDPQSGQYRMMTNPTLVAEFDALLTRTGKTSDDPIFLICRSRNRSAVAARMLIAAGYSNVWNLTEGFEGDRASDGTRTKNGWRNAGLPWGYSLNHGVAWTGCQEC